MDKLLSLPMLLRHNDVGSNCRGNTNVFSKILFLKLMAKLLFISEGAEFSANASESLKNTH